MNKEHYFSRVDHSHYDIYDDYNDTNDDDDIICDDEDIDNNVVKFTNIEDND